MDYALNILKKYIYFVYWSAAQARRRPLSGAGILRPPHQRVPHRFSMRDAFSYAAESSTSASPYATLAAAPKAITGPAMVNIFAAVPRT